MITDGELDFATYPQFKFETTKELLAHFEDCSKKPKPLYKTPTIRFLKTNSRSNAMARHCIHRRSRSTQPLGAPPRAIDRVHAHEQNQGAVWR